MRQAGTLRNRLKCVLRVPNGVTRIRCRLWGGKSRVGIESLPRSIWFQLDIDELLNGEEGVGNVGRRRRSVGRGGRVHSGPDLAGDEEVGSMRRVVFIPPHVIRRISTHHERRQAPIPAPVIAHSAACRGSDQKSCQAAVTVTVRESPNLRQQQEVNPKKETHRTQEESWTCGRRCPKCLGRRSELHGFADWSARAWLWAHRCTRTRTDSQSPYTRRWSYCWATESEAHIPRARSRAPRPCAPRRRTAPAHHHRQSTIDTRYGHRQDDIARQLDRNPLILTFSCCSKVARSRLLNWSCGSSAASVSLVIQLWM